MLFSSIVLLDTLFSYNTINLLEKLLQNKGCYINWRQLRDGI
jgi:hypothetical protein